MKGYILFFLYVHLIYSILMKPVGHFLEYKDHNLYVKRLFYMTQNKLKNQLSCVYCKGYGYLTCYFCTTGCWRCEHSTLLKCYVCTGHEKGKYAYVKIPS